MAGTKQKHRKTSKGVQVGLKGLAAKVELAQKAIVKAELPQFRAGDTVRVHVKIKEGDKERVQAYEGVVIARDGKGGSKSFNVRKMSHGVGVERIFLENSQRVAKVEVVQEGKVRRAKLYYLRELEGKAARIERNVETQEAAAAKAAAKASKAK